MHPICDPDAARRPPWRSSDFATLSEADAAALVAVARRLRGAAGASPLPSHLLRGKNIALLGGRADEDDVAVFRRAASGLGAQVAHLTTHPSGFRTPRDLRHTAELLGRLYDALDCTGMPAALVSEIGAVAGVPVFESIRSSSHPVARLAKALDTDAVAARCAVLQAVLLSTLA